MQHQDEHAASRLHITGQAHAGASAEQMEMAEIEKAHASQLGVPQAGGRQRLASVNLTFDGQMSAELENIVMKERASSFMGARGPLDSDLRCAQYYTDP